MMAVFQVCFFVGVALTILSLVLGGLGDFLGLDGIDGFDIGLDGFGIDFSLPLNPVLYIVLLTVFGGVGMILRMTTALAGILIVLIAFAAGLCVSILLYKFVIKPLKKAQNTSSPDNDDLIGVLASVSEKIQEGGFGQISYVVNGNSFTAPARTTTGKAAAAGEEVSICWIQDHVFFVAPLKDLLSDDGEEGGRKETGSQE